jgi:hypothetical protein
LNTNISAFSIRISRRHFKLLDNVIIYIEIFPNPQNEIALCAGQTENLLSDLQSIKGVNSEMLPGTKSGLGAGTMISSIVEAGGLVSFIKIILGYLTKDRSRTLKLQIGDNVIEASGLTSKEQRDLIDWFQLQTGMKLSLH